jgi:sugar phosphate isomerase/epimerase
LKLLGVTPVAAAVIRPEGVSAEPQAEAGRWPIGLVSRHVQWTDLEGAIDVARRIGFDEIEWNVRAGAHVLPERVEEDLPRAVDLTRKAGLDVRMITTSIQDARSPHAEAILATASGLGIKVYRGGEYFRYDYGGNLAQQLEALKPRIATLAALNEKYDTTVAYHTHSSRGIIGGNIWDFWTVLRDFHPRFVGLNYDIGHATARGGLGWVDGAHVVAPMIRAAAIKDFRWTKGHRDQDRALRAKEPDTVAWGVDWQPLGDGMVDFPRFFTFLKTIRFSGPINLHLEHNDLLGTEVGAWKLHITPQRFIEIVKRDLDYLRTTIERA